MKLLRKYIRSLLEADFGEKFKPDKLEDSEGLERHAPEEEDGGLVFEPDTEEERNVYRTLWHFLMGGQSERQADIGEISGENMDLILQAMDNPKYKDVFARYPAPGFSGPFPVRGSMMSSSQLDKILPTWRQMVYDFRVKDPERLGLSSKDPEHGYDIQDEDPHNWGDEPEYWSDTLDISYTYMSRAVGGLSHWSRDPMVAHSFAMGDYGGKELSDRMIPVILYANPNKSANDFLDMTRLYQYNPFGRLSDENEVIGFGPIEVVGIEIYLPNYADLGPKAKIAGTREDMKESLAACGPILRSEIARAKFRGVPRHDVNAVLVRGGSDDQLAAEISSLRGTVSEPREYIQESAQTANGDCYEAAGKFMMDSCQLGASDCNLILVHGEVMGQGSLGGVTFGHAWVIDGNTVVDKSNGRDIQMPQPVYYALGQIDNIGNVHQYTWSDARKQILDSGHWGPWELVTETGL